MRSLTHAYPTVDLTQKCVGSHSCFLVCIPLPRTLPLLLCQLSHFMAHYMLKPDTLFHITLTDAWQNLFCLLFGTIARFILQSSERDPQTSGQLLLRLRTRYASPSPPTPLLKNNITYTIIILHRDWHFVLPSSLHRAKRSFNHSLDSDDLRRFATGKKEQRWWWNRPQEHYNVMFHHLQFARLSEQIDIKRSQPQNWTKMITKDFWAICVPSY